MAIPLVLSNVGKLAENIISASFRNEAHFKISKDLRKKAYTQSLDVMIESIDYNLYENFNANPSIKHYGYIQLVFQDAFSRIYPITQFRQRFLDIRQEQAIQLWKDWIKFYQQEYYFYIGEEQRKQLATAANIEDFIDSGFNPLTRSQFIGEQGWIELPLREVHVKMLKNCSFSIDYSQWQPVPFNELWSGLISINGESQMIDGDKDNGVPNGSEPIQNNPSNPWQGTSNPDSDLSLAGKGFDSASPDDWGLPLKRFAFIEGQYLDGGRGCIKINFGIPIEISPLDNLVKPTVRSGYPQNSACNTPAVLADIIGETTLTNYGIIGGDGTYRASYANAHANPFTYYSTP
jgi:hypothetical protein